jgi:HPt (histidine-containing phosphotransfer) domain-containing protein
MKLPEELVNQFRTVAQERLARIEAAWAQVMSAVDDEAAALLHREIHTLKGESQMLGFSDVNVVCHKLEDLVEVARARGYAVDEDFDLTVNMALRFMTMLARKKVGSQLGGIDLPGFLKQIDQVLAESRPDAPRARSSSLTPLNRTSGAPRVPAFLRDRLATIAVDSFIEYAAAEGARRNRLRFSWHTLRDMIGLQRAVLGPAQLVKLEQNGHALARELGKEIEVKFELSSAEVTAEVLAAIDVATLHLARNAVDHGIEAPAVRRAAGKSPRGRITLRGGVRDDRLVIVLEDDGAGIQFDRVRARAVELGISAAAVEALDHDRLIELMCQPGFTTRTAATDISGRGVGLDAVRAAVVELGGSLSASSVDGAGSSWTVSIPVPRLGIHGHVLRVSGLPFPLVVDAAWQILLGETAERVVDPATALGFPGTGSGDLVVFEREGVRVGVRCDRAPMPMLGRRLVVTPARALGEVVLLDSVEALLLRLERF